ncbi:hypothetical protein Tsubulata_028451 [Turnera subulata]|uniref:Uncharacterized protein n=1 Tax=Turnera subulata TaxID=218843 RepID=A0A9Q0J0H4_9ROSI|nr:hypothetical protein Tsubulata_028451 [Turnera subulata]
MSVKVESTKAIKPVYGSISPTTTKCMPLSVFDKYTYDCHFSVIYAYRAPTPSNEVLIEGLEKVLTQYREWAGRLVENEKGVRVILLNDEGVKVVEATVEDATIDEFMPSSPSPVVLSLHPSLKDPEALMQLQLTKFKCGSMTIGVTAHHFVADGGSASQFFVAWGKACRGVGMGPPPFHDRTIFDNQEKPSIIYDDHIGVEFKRKKITKEVPQFSHDVNDIVFEKVHFPLDFIKELKSKASASQPNGTGNDHIKPYSTFVCLLAHLWRAITKARGLDGCMTTKGRIAVNGRRRMNLQVPDEYFGNLVLWATPTTKVKDLQEKPVSYAEKLIHDAITNVNDSYYKSFIYFATHKVEEEDLVPTADPSKKYASPDVQVESWLNLPFCDFDFGGGKPYLFMPSCFPIEGLMFLLPSPEGDGSVDAMIALFRDNLTSFREVCLLLV